MGSAPHTADLCAAIDTVLDNPINPGHLDLRALGQLRHELKSSHPSLDALRRLLECIVFGHPASVLFASLELAARHRAYEVRVGRVEGEFSMRIPDNQVYTLGVSWQQNTVSAQVWAFLMDLWGLQKHMYKDSTDDHIGGLGLPDPLKAVRVQFIPLALERNSTLVIGGITILNLSYKACPLRKVYSPYKTDSTSSVPTAMAIQTRTRLCAPHVVRSAHHSLMWRHQVQHQQGLLDQLAAFWQGFGWPPCQLLPKISPPP